MGSGAEGHAGAGPRRSLGAAAGPGRGGARTRSAASPLSCGARAPETPGPATARRPTATERRRPRGHRSGAVGGTRGALPKRGKREGAKAPTKRRGDATAARVGGAPPFGGVGGDWKRGHIPRAGPNARATPVKVRPEGLSGRVECREAPAGVRGEDPRDARLPTGKRSAGAHARREERRNATTGARGRRRGAALCGDGATRERSERGARARHCGHKAALNRFFLAPSDERKRCGNRGCSFKRVYFRSFCAEVVILNLSMDTASEVVKWYEEKT